MSYGKIKFADGKVAELVEVGEKHYVVRMESGKEFRLMKSGSRYSEVETQIEKLVKGGAKKVAETEEVEEDIEDSVEQTEEVDTEQDETEEDVVDENTESDEEEVEPEPVKKVEKAAKPEKPAKKGKKEARPSDSFDWDATDGFLEKTDVFEGFKDINQAVMHLFTADDSNAAAVCLLLLGEKCLVDKVEGLNVDELKTLADETKKRPKESDFVGLAKLLANNIANPSEIDANEIIAMTAVDDEKSVFTSFDIEYRASVFDKMNKRFADLVSNADKVTLKLFK